jgi:ABC-type uncharacterized transport system permease subunit
MLFDVLHTSLPAKLRCVMLTLCTSASQNAVKPVASSFSHKLQLASFSVVKLLLSLRQALIACVKDNHQQQQHQDGELKCFRPEQ